MSFLTLNRETAEECFKNYIEYGSYTDETFEVGVKKNQNYNFDENCLQDLYIKLYSVTDNFSKAWEIDKNVSIKLHSFLELDVNIAENPGFWRYLTFSNQGRFLDLIKDRYFKNYEDKNEDQFRIYSNLSMSSNNFFEAYFKRCWETANILCDKESEDHYHLIKNGPEDVDFFHSHVIRLSTGSIKNVIQSFVKYVIDHKIPRGNKKDNIVGYRQFARILRAYNTNIDYTVLTLDDSYELINALWNDREKWDKLF